MADAASLAYPLCQNSFFSQTALSDEGPLILQVDGQQAEAVLLLVAHHLPFQPLRDLVFAESVLVGVHDVLILEHRGQVLPVVAGQSSQSQPLCADVLFESLHVKDSIT